MLEQDGVRVGIAVAEILDDPGHRRTQGHFGIADPQSLPEDAAGVSGLLSQRFDLFKQRASLEQSYDLGAQGRFARYALGFVLAGVVVLAILGTGFIFFRRHRAVSKEQQKLTAQQGKGPKVLVATTITVTEPVPWSTLMSENCSLPVSP